MTDLIQTIAAAIYTASGPNARAKAVLTAINEAGLVIVPRKATHEMCQIGAPSRFAPDDTEAIWSAMIEVGAITTGETGNG